MLLEEVINLSRGPKIQFTFLGISVSGLHYFYRPKDSVHLSRYFSFRLALFLEAQRLSSQSAASGPATHAGVDLNSQGPASEGFPGLGLYRAFLQSDDGELLPQSVRGSGLPPYRE